MSKETCFGLVHIDGSALKNDTAMATLRSASGPPFSIENWHIIVRIRVCEYLKVYLASAICAVVWQTWFAAGSNLVLLPTTRYDTVAVSSGAMYVVEMLTNSATQCSVFLGPSLVGLRFSYAISAVGGIRGIERRRELQAPQDIIICNKLNHFEGTRSNHLITAA